MTHATIGAADTRHPPFEEEEDAPARSVRPRICQVLLKRPEPSETFLLDHARHLPADVAVVHGMVPHVGSAPVLSTAAVPRAWRRLQRLARARPWQWEITEAYCRAFARTGAQAVLAEYGPAGVRVLEACERARLPLVVHFHGYDASDRRCLQQHADGYQRLFRTASAIVAVSHEMKQRLERLGAPAERTHYCPCGVDCGIFCGGSPDQRPPTFVAVGRFVEKKAPHLTILAFAGVHRQRPDARLRMIGDGPLLPLCRDLVTALGVGDAVELLGVQPHARIAEELRLARGFVQHSQTASSGNSEGTPVSVLEAAASGLPVVATRHAGIPDVVADGETGYLVSEGDVEAMTDRLVRLVDDPESAAMMGRGGRERVELQFRMDRAVGRLWMVIARSITARGRTEGSHR